MATLILNSCQIFDIMQKFEYPELMNSFLKEDKVEEITEFEEIPSFECRFLVP
jgi:hypothetical protein